MKKIYTLSILFLLALHHLFAQPCDAPGPGNPQMGAMIEPQFSNLWKQAKVEDKHGESFKTTNTPSIGDDGWLVDGVNHNFRFYWDDIQPKLKNGDILKVRFKGTITQVGAGIEACAVQNIVSDGTYTTFEVKITNTSSPNGFAFQLKNRCTDIQIMRPGYTFDDSRLLVDEYVTHIAHWGTLRYMGLLSAYSNFGQTWEKRVSTNAPAYINQWQWSAPQCDVPLPQFPKFSENQLPFKSSWGTDGMWSPGAPWETLIDISNYTNKDMWINVPVMADDNYVLQLSKLLKQRLKPTLNVHVEIGNELWNFGPPFMGFDMQKQVMSEEWNSKNPEKLKIFGGSNCPSCNLLSYEELNIGYPAPNRSNLCEFNDWTAYQRWMARRLKEMMEQFAIDWGWKQDGGVGSRIRATLAGQVGYGGNGHGWNIGHGLEFLSKAYGPDAPSKYLYSLSVAPYFKPDEPSSDGQYKFTINLPVDQIINNYVISPMNNWFGQFSVEEGDPSNYFVGNKLEGVFGKAKINGLKMYAYEGGNEIGNAGYGANGWAAYTNAPAVFKNQSFGVANTNLLNEWYSWFGGDALFIKNGDYVGSNNNAYGMSETLNEDNALRRSYISVGSAKAPAFTTKREGLIGIAKVSILDARKYAGYSKDWSTSTTITYESKVNATYTEKTNNNWDKPFIIRNEKTGIYKFSLERTVLNDMVYDKANPTICDIYLNEKLIFKDVNMAIDPNSGWTAPLTMEIPYGIHALRVQPVYPTANKPGNYSSRINQINISKYKFELDKECTPLNVETENSTASITVFPNPTQDGRLEVRLTSNQRVNALYLLDIQGRLLKNFSVNNEIYIDLSDLQDGCYQLVMDTNHGREVKKIVKMK